jgi:uncharacterized protein (TIGR02569 family)
MPDKSIKPPKSVLHAFGLTGEPVLLKGGEGQSYRVGNTVLKPVYDEEQACWYAQVLGQINLNGVRINRPIRAQNEQWISQGWQAFEYLEGKSAKGRWEEKVEISRNFHQKLDHIQRPQFIGHRDNLWEQADLAVWQKKPLVFSPQIRHITDRLTSILQPLNPTNQLIYGDMTGNIIFHPSLPPAVIDFSPYWRPAEYASAIIVVDAIVWENAKGELINAIKNTPQNNQLLIRAALWRIKTSELFSNHQPRKLIQEINHYHHLTTLISARTNN